MVNAYIIQSNDMTKSHSKLYATDYTNKALTIQCASDSFLVS